jgi:hypothetical protein
MQDYVLLSAAWMLNLQVTTTDEAGNEVPDDGSYQRHCAESVYVFGEFMRDKGLLNPGVVVTRSPDFKLRFSDLTETGQAFSKAALDKWMQAKDRAGMTKPVDSRGLERRWKKFNAA